MAITSVTDFGAAVEALIVEAKAAEIPTVEIIAELEGILDGLSDEDEPTAEEEE